MEISCSKRARLWLEGTYGPGTADDIVACLAQQLWETSYLAPPRSKLGRVPSGKALLAWGESVGIRRILPPRQGQKASVKPCQNGFQMAIRGVRRAKRNYEDAVRSALEMDPAVRWDFAHELGHTFFYDKSFDPPKKTYGRDDAGEESLCQKYAAELLLPRHRLKKRLSSNQSLTAKSIIDLANMYGAPLRATVRRLIQDLQLTKTTCVVISERVADVWERYYESKRALPKTGIEVFAPPNPTFILTEERLRSDITVRSVCSSKGYSCRNGLHQARDDFAFIEGLTLRQLAPRRAKIIFFHEETPNPKEGLLFTSLR